MNSRANRHRLDFGYTAFRFLISGANAVWNSSIVSRPDSTGLVGTLLAFATCAEELEVARRSRTDIGVALVVGWMKRLNDPILDVHIDPRLAMG